MRPLNCLDDPQVGFATSCSGVRQTHTHPGAVCMPAKAQDFTWRLKDGSHAISISLFSMFHALRLHFPCLFSLLLLVYSHVT